MAEEGGATGRRGQNKQYRSDSLATIRYRQARLPDDATHVISHSQAVATPTSVLVSRLAERYRTYKGSCPNFIDE